MSNEAINELLELLDVFAGHTPTTGDLRAAMERLASHNNVLEEENSRLRDALAPFVYEDGCGGHIKYCARGEEKCRWCRAAEASKETERHDG